MGAEKLINLLAQKQGDVPDSTFSKSLGFSIVQWGLIKNGKRGISADFLGAVGRVYPDLRGAINDYLWGELPPSETKASPGREDQDKPGLQGTAKPAESPAVAAGDPRDPKPSQPDPVGEADGGTVKDEPGGGPGETAAFPTDTMEPPGTPEAADLNQSATLTSASSNQEAPLSPCTQCMKKHSGNYFVYFCGAKAYDPSQPELFPPLQNMEEPSGHGSAVDSPPTRHTQPQALPPETGTQAPPPLQGNAGIGPEACRQQATPPGSAPLAETGRLGEAGVEVLAADEKEDAKIKFDVQVSGLNKPQCTVHVEYEPAFMNHLAFYGEAISVSGYRSYFGLISKQKYNLEDVKRFAQEFANELVKMRGLPAKQRAKYTSRVKLPEPISICRPWGEGYACEKCGHRVSDMLCPGCFKEGFNRWIPRGYECTLTECSFPCARLSHEWNSTNSVSTPRVPVNNVAGDSLPGEGARDIGEAPGDPSPQPSPANVPEAAIAFVEAASPSPEKEPPLRIFRIRNNKTHEWWEGSATHPGRAIVLTGFPAEECWIRERSPAYGWMTPHELKGAKSAAELMPSTTRGVLGRFLTPQPVVSQTEADALEAAKRRFITVAPPASSPAPTAGDGQEHDYKVLELIEEAKRRPDLLADIKKLFPVNAARGRGRPKNEEGPQAQAGLV